MNALEPTSIVVVPLVNHLTAAALRVALSPATQLLRAGSRLLLLVDCVGMTGYDAEARAQFVSWNAAHRHRIDRVAIVTDNALWHMVIAAMSLASAAGDAAVQDLGRRPRLARGARAPGVLDAAESRGAPARRLSGSTTARRA